MNLPPVGAPSDSRATVDHAAHHRALARNVGDSTDWKPLVMESPWMEDPTDTEYPYEKYTPGYRRIGPLVILRGVVRPYRDTTVSMETITTLPEGYRPGTGRGIFVCWTNSYADGRFIAPQRVDVYPDGRVVAQEMRNYGPGSGGSTYGRIALNGIHFLAKDWT